MKLLPYPKYKQSGVEWLGEVPAHWEVRTLTSIANEILITTQAKRNLRSRSGIGGVLSAT